MSVHECVKCVRVSMCKCECVRVSMCECECVRVSMCECVSVCERVYVVCRAQGITRDVIWRVDLADLEIVFSGYWKLRHALIRNILYHLSCMID